MITNKLHKIIIGLGIVALLTTSVFFSVKVLLITGYLSSKKSDSKYNIKPNTSIDKISRSDEMQLDKGVPRVAESRTSETLRSQLKQAPTTQTDPSTSITTTNKTSTTQVAKPVYVDEYEYDGYEDYIENHYEEVNGSIDESGD